MGLALGLYGAGALWNSFIFAGSAPALLELFEATRPDLVRSHREHLLVQGLKDPREPALLRAQPQVDFCSDILQSDVDRLRVLIVPPCGWTDLGTPQRVNRWLERTSAFPPGGANRGVERQPLPDLREAITSV